MSDWKLNGKETLFEGPYGMTIENWKFTMHNGEDRDFTIRKGKDFVIVLAITEKNEVVVVHEYFPANQKKLASLVGGIIDDGDDHRKTAEKELLEESGYAAEKFIYLGELSRGKYNSGIMYTYLAIGAKKVQDQTLEPEEDIDIELVPIEQFRIMLKENKIGCVFEVSAGYQALDYLDKLS